MKTHYQAIVDFFSKMDIEMLDTFLEMGQYQDMPKSKFMALLRNAFDTMKKSGDVRLEMYRGTCMGCAKNKGCTGFSFVGNRTGNYINMIIKENQDRVTDIFECSSFESENSKKRGRKIWVDDMFRNNDYITTD